MFGAHRANPWYHVCANCPGWHARHFVAGANVPRHNRTRANYCAVPGIG